MNYYASLFNRGAAGGESCKDIYGASLEFSFSHLKERKSRNTNIHTESDHTIKAIEVFIVSKFDRFENILQRCLLIEGENSVSHPVES